MTAIQSINRTGSTSEPRTSDIGLYNIPTNTIPSLKVVLRKGEDGWWIAQCKDYPAAISQGRTKDDALRNVVEAIELVLEDQIHGDAPIFMAYVEEQ